MAQSSVAYDLDLFRSRDPRLVALKDNKKAKADKQRRNRRQAVLNLVVYLTLAVIVLGMVGYFITSNVRLTELNKQIVDGKAELSALQSEQVRLQSELAAKVSAERVNQYAQEKGLVPISSNQIYYIEAKQQDQVSLASESDGWFRKACKAFTDFLS